MTTYGTVVFDNNTRLVGKAAAVNPAFALYPINHERTYNTCAKSTERLARCTTLILDYDKRHITLSALLRNAVVATNLASP